MKRSRFLISLTLLLSLGLFLAACGASETETETPDVAVVDDTVVEEEAMDETIVDIAVADGRFTTLVAALGAAELVDTLAGEGPFTVFAPTDDAFAALPAGTVEGLLEDPSGALTDILLYHVVSGAVNAETVVTLDSATTVNGEDVAITVRDGNVYLNDTVQVIITDIEASNGIIHVIDGVLLPPSMTADDDMMMDETIVDIAVADGRFTTLVAALGAADLADTLAGEGPFTVFAPTDDAFAALPAGTVEGLLEDPSGALTDILLYHVVSGSVNAETVVTLDSATTVNGEDVAITVRDGNVYLNDTVQVIITDIEASNGIIHVIDGVLLPPSMTADDDMMMDETIVDIAVADGRFTTLVAALGAADLADTLAGEGPFTVFAPTDDAFAALPAGTVESLLEEPGGMLTDILLYHVVAGSVNAETVVTLDSATTLNGADVQITIQDGKVYLNDTVQVIITDIEASNGIIHVIDGVLLPPAVDTSTQTIVEIAVADGRFNTLVAALEAADLAETLSGEGPFTVFAPTDDAFAALPDGTIDTLLADPSGALTDILLYHVVAGSVNAETVVTLDMATTLNGADVHITVQDGKVYLNDTVQVIITDIQASNGIIHVIDAVLLPPQ